MGIHDLSKVLGDHAPAATKDNEIKNYFGRKVAIDASMSIYQFLIAVRSDGQVLTNEAGETTSHLMGMFYRTVRILENGIKPVYVFDGKPPTMKSGELMKRTQKRKEAEENLENAGETGTAEDVEKFTRRTVRVTKEHNEECKRLLRLMGVPYVEAPCEAEAQCAALCKAGKVYATASEDMDSLTCGTKVLLRHLTFSEARKEPIKEIHLDKVLEGLDLTMDQFIDLCILLGCDYCDSIHGIGRKRAYDLIAKHKTLEEVLKNIDAKKHTIPENWPFAEARELFRNPEVTDPESFDFKWNAPDEEGIVQFLVREKGFSEERVRSTVKKIDKSRSTATQGRLDGFFTVVPAPAGEKRKAADANDPKKKAKTAPGPAKKTPGKPGGGKFRR